MHVYAFLMHHHLLSTFPGKAVELFPFLISLTCLEAHENLTCIAEISHVTLIPFLGNGRKRGLTDYWKVLGSEETLLI